MLASRDECLEILRCPVTREKLRFNDGQALVGEGGDNAPRKTYPVINGAPVLVDFSRSVLNEQETLDNAAKSVVARQDYRGPAKFIKNLLSPPKKATRNNVARLIGDLTKRSEPANILIIGGGSIGQGMAPVYEHPSIRVFVFDIYASPNVHFIADAHHLPLPADYFDAVIIQAVLEHTLQPAEVVAEIWRVLKPDGLVYAETPFMQQVHEGAYDFTRFSESGHRYLFKGFSVIASGVSGGPGRQFMWSADYFARAVFRSRLAGKLAKLAFFWAQYFDNIIPERYAIDGASGVYFYGRKAGAPITPMDAVQHYQGAQ